MWRAVLVAVVMNTSVAVGMVCAQGLTAMDEQVIAKVHQANQMEMQLGKMAQQKGASAEIKRYGGLLVRDHQKGDQLVARLAKQKGMSAIPEPKADSAADKEEMQKQQMMMQQLQQAEGHEFDAAFAKAMVVAHEKAVAMVGDASTQVSDADLRDTLKKLVPILKQHLAIAQRLSSATTAATQR